nr:UbiD family decarboxylase domain-containing protein [Candidatus Brachybacter algidus]
MKKVHAVDAAGVHPLLFAIGSERYMPFRDQRPEEILTIANRLLGSGQTSLAKYLFITAQDSDIVPDVYDVKGFLKYIFERIEFKRDLHFITKTTIDTLDYSGDGLNHGSKLIIAAYGPPLRQLKSTLPHDLVLPPGFQDPKFFTSGILCVKGPKYENRKVAHAQAGVLASYIERFDWQGVALIVICDDVDFTTATDNNFAWVTFNDLGAEAQEFLDVLKTDPPISIRLNPLRISTNELPNDAVIPWESQACSSLNTKDLHLPMILPFMPGHIMCKKHQV